MPEQEFWSSMWDRSATPGFHQSEVHKALLADISKLPTPPQGKTVLVPLCGKTLDMLYLRQRGYTVVGVEFVEKACLDFFSENSLPHHRSTTSSGRVYHHTGDGQLVIFQGDYFAVTLEDIMDAGVGVAASGVHCAYDRAALVAIDPARREEYVHHTLSLLTPTAPILLTTIHYDQSLMQGPPFSVTREAVETLYGKECDVECLDEGQMQVGRRGFAMGDGVYWVTKREGVGAKA